MQTVTRLDPLRSAVAALRADGPLALVPTMGALHEGHLTLVREARQRAAHVAVSIFVNPRQFGANEDLDKYPRQMAADSALLQAEGVSLLWAPTVEAMYPQGYATNISVSGVSDGLCGAARPGHFDGVATVVCKLFNQVRPDIALFGEKDWQQLALIRAMAATRHPEIQIVGVPTVREPDGLAMSSRNRYLSPAERETAALIPAALRDIAAAGGTDESIVRAAAKLDHVGIVVDYLDVVDPMTLEPTGGDEPARAIIAARVGATRLIDNLSVRD